MHQRQLGAGGKVNFVVEVVLLLRMGRIPDEGTRTGRELNSLGQVVASFFFVFWRTGKLLRDLQYNWGR